MQKSDYIQMNLKYKLPLNSSEAQIFEYINTLNEDRKSVIFKALYPFYFWEALEESHDLIKHGERERNNQLVSAIYQLQQRLIYLKSIYQDRNSEKELLNIFPATNSPQQDFSEHKETKTAVERDFILSTKSKNSNLELVKNSLSSAENKNKTNDSLTQQASHNKSVFNHSLVIF